MKKRSTHDNPSISSDQGAPSPGAPIQSSFSAGGNETQEDVSEMNVKQQLSRAAVVGLPVLAFGPLAVGCANRPHAGDAGSAEAMGASIDVNESILDVDAPRPQDERAYRAFTLENGLQVLLVSDPKMQKSAAAMDVAVGSLEDPWDGLGTAHYLEHLLFLGTEKYPDVDGYNEFLSANGGNSNAYTASERTNYQLQVNHDGLEEALDRFSQFFIAPRFDPDFVEREANAVNSEHQKNLQDDFWRKRMIQRALHRDGHPRQKFSTGDLTTLEGATRDGLIEFYKKYYSANVMRLVIMGNQDLNQLEGWAREKFAAVPNFDRAKITYPTDVFDPNRLPMVIEVKPVTDTRTLELEFAMPSDEEYWKQKPNRLIGALIGHEGEGSLLSELKKQGLATGLSSGAMTESYASYFNARVTLTRAGRENVDQVIALFFTYVDMLRKEGLKDYFYHENKVMAELDYYYRDHQEGMWAASGYAASMQQHPALEFLKRESLFYEYDPELFMHYLSFIQPELLRATLVAPDVETDAVEEHYGSEYKAYQAPADRVATWKTPVRAEAFRYPDPNPFLPNDLTLLSTGAESAPAKLIEDERGTFWFEQDQKFQLPKAELSLRFLTAETNSSPRHRLLATLYARAINEGLNEWSYPAHEAGLSANVSADARGVELNIAGYSQRIPDLLEAYSKQLAEVRIDEETYAAIQDQVARDYANASFDQAYTQTFYEYNILMNPVAIHRDLYKDMVKDITLDDVRAYAKSVLAESAIEGAAYGNLDPSALRLGIEHAFSNVSQSVLPEDERPRRDQVSLQGMKPKAWVFPSKTDNSCWMSYVQFGPRTPEQEALLRIGAAHFKPGFYGDMRSRQQLGYIVFRAERPLQLRAGLFFLIQSGDYPAGELAKRAETWIDENVPTIREMPDEDYGAIQAAIVDELAQTETNMGERLSTLKYEGVELGGQFDWKASVSAAVQSLSKEDVASAFETAFSDAGRASLSLYLNPDGAETTVPAEELLVDPTTFKRRPVF
ncbi:MAG: insulinase family protein [Candidatus Eisenbacteria bacterium]